MWLQNVPNGTQMGRIREEPITSDLMPQVTYYGSSEGALTHAELQLCFTLALENLTEAMQMLFLEGGEDDDVQVKQPCFPMELS